MIAKEESKSAWCVLSTTLPTRSQDYFSSSYPNTVKFSLKRKANCARCVLAATLPRRCSRDYFSSSYPNTIKFDKNVLRWRKSNSIFEPSASKLVAFSRLPLRSSQDSIESFTSTKGGALWIRNVLIGLSRREIPIIDLLDFCVIYFEIWPAVPMSQILHWIRFKIRGSTDGF